MNKNFFLILLVLSSTVVQSQFIKEKSLNTQIGYGLSAPFNRVDPVVSGGFFIQEELILKATSWIGFRPYISFISTSSDGKGLDGNPTDEKAESKAFLLGSKVRVRAPIPWVAPYFEIGAGASIGKFETFTAFDDIDKSGIIYHIPFSFGLELGKEHNFDLGLAYFIQPSVEQYAGAFTIGFVYKL